MTTITVSFVINDDHVEDFMETLDEIGYKNHSKILVEKRTASVAEIKSLTYSEDE